MSTDTIFLSSTPVRGIIRIYNIQDDRTLLVASEDMAKDIRDIRFQLDLNIYGNEILQEEYDRIGLELFAIEPWETALPGEDLGPLKARTETMLKERHIPFYESN
jgi:hypothetical protein